LPSSNIKRRKLMTKLLSFLSACALATAALGFMAVPALAKCNASGDAEDGVPAYYPTLQCNTKIQSIGGCIPIANEMESGIMPLGYCAGGNAGPQYSIPACYGAAGEQQNWDYRCNRDYANDGHAGAHCAIVLSTGPITDNGWDQTGDVVQCGYLPPNY
jgi:hypothetical protein